MATPRERLLEREPVLPVNDIQGDILLGFNKPYSQNVVIDIDETKIDLAKNWLRNVVLPNVSTAANVLEHRNTYRQIGYDKYTGPAFVNVALGYPFLEKLLTSEQLDEFFQIFSRNSPFVMGASRRASLLGDNPTKWDFNSDPANKPNNDVVLTISADKRERVDEMMGILLKDRSAINVVSSIEGFRGERKDLLYGHEHFGFQDGLSQPEVRGTYLKENGEQKEFIVRRHLDESDERYSNYAKPGFRLLSTGLFLLGHDDNVEIDLQSNNASEGVPDSVDNYPEWCKHASFQVYRVISQDVASFWQFHLAAAKSVNDEYSLDLDEEGLRSLAGDLAAKAVGRWWDGTPLIFGKPLSGLHYPPAEDDARAITLKERLRFQGVPGLKNGFNFASSEAGWKVKSKIIAPPNASKYAADALGVVCPFGAHVRKVQPRDDPTDDGLGSDTLRNRMIRRGNNFGKSRVRDVFEAPENDDSRGLLFVVYVANISKQFEFVQRQWANSATAPKDGGIDIVIGSSESRSIPVEIDTAKGKLQVKLEATEKFTTALGMSYGIVLTKSALSTILDVPTSDIVLDAEVEGADVGE